MLQVRCCILGIALVAGCRATDPGSGSTESSSPTASPDAPSAALPRVATQTVHDRIAGAVLVDYDSARHRVRVKPTATGYSVGLEAGGFVTASIPFGLPEGQDARAFVEKEGALLPVFVVVRSGAEWAAGKRVALIVVGSDPGMYGVVKGVLALINRDDSVELAGAWEKEGASSPQHPPSLKVAFTLAGSTELLLEKDSSDGEGATGATSFYRVWMRETVRGSEGKWARDAEHPIMTTYEDVAGRQLHPGWESTMTSTLKATARGLNVRETWTFKSGSKTKTTTVDQLYEVSGNVIRVDRKQPAP